MPKPRFLTHLDREARIKGRDLLLDVDHEPQLPPSTNGHECPVGDIGEMHGHGSARAERVRSDVFLDGAKSCCSYLQALGSNDGDDVECTGGAESMIGGIITDRVDGITLLVA